VISVHSFTKQYEDRPLRDYQVGILFRERGLLVDRLETAFKKDGISYRLNEPYKPSEGVCFAMDCIETYNDAGRTDAVLLEFRNDYCSDKSFRERITNVMTPLINDLKNH
jgi:predicted N-formylglutamate amidohydrolase